jgi:hypothetical protein
VFAQRMMSAEVEELRGTACEEGQPGPGELRNGYRRRLSGRAASALPGPGYRVASPHAAQQSGRPSPQRCLPPRCQVAVTGLEQAVKAVAQQAGCE